MIRKEIPIGEHMSNPSILSRIVKSILKLTKPAYMTSQEKIDEYLANKEDKKIKSIFKNNRIPESLFFGDENNSGIIIYIHGGAYVNQLNIQHKLYCWLLNKVLKIPVVMPIYPLTPNHDYRECFEQIEELYTMLTDKYQKIVLIGDSAGGGFILSFCQYLKTTNIRQADNIIAISPWVDISMKNNYDDRKDVILGNIGLKEIGKRWANNTDTRDHMVSPLYGDNHKLPKTLITTGTDEIFYQDIKEYYEKLIVDGVDAKLIVGKDLFHIYPLFPIPEAISILKEIKKEIM